jgi:TrmH family RNA methyltransferase
LNETIITSKQNNLIKEASKLKQKKYRNISNTFLVEGNHLVNEAYQAGLIEIIFYVETCDFKNVEAYQVSQVVLDSLTEVVANQGIAAVCRKPIIFNDFKKVLLLDNVQDPGNIGTLIRSAVSFGFDTLVAENSVDFYNDKVIRSTQGALFKINLLTGNLVQFIKKNNDIEFYVTDLKSDCYLEDLKIKSKLIGIVLGNEGQGVREEIISLVNNSFKLRMSNMESLNVGVAGSIILYELAKRSELL